MARQRLERPPWRSNGFAAFRYNCFVAKLPNISLPDERTAPFTEYLKKRHGFSLIRRENEVKGARSAAVEIFLSAMSVPLRAKKYYRDPLT
jgi:hypothetical protein